jgi:hypothetical protein
MTLLDGAIYGSVGSALYQLYSFQQFIVHRKIWPWDDIKNGQTLTMYVVGCIIHLILGTVTAALMALGGEISGVIGALAIGMTPDAVIANVAKKGRLK